MGDGDDVEDVPPLMLAARRAWLGGGDGGRFRETDEQTETINRQEDASDLAQEAEDLSIDLAEFMLQPIG